MSNTKDEKIVTIVSRVDNEKDITQRNQLMDELAQITEENKRLKEILLFAWEQFKKEAKSAEENPAVLSTQRTDNPKTPAQLDYKPTITHNERKRGRELFARQPTINKRSRL